MTTLKWSRSRNSTATRPVVAPGAGQGAVEPVEQQRAVGQAGERVVGGLVGQPLLERLALADVAGDAGDVLEAALGVVMGEDLGEHGHDAPVGPHDLELAAPAALALRARPRPRW